MQIKPASDIRGFGNSEHLLELTKFIHNECDTNGLFDKSPYLPGGFSDCVAIVTDGIPFLIGTSIIGDAPCITFQHPNASKQVCVLNGKSDSDEIYVNVSDLQMVEACLNFLKVEITKRRVTQDILYDKAMALIYRFNEVGLIKREATFHMKAGVGIYESHLDDEQIFIILKSTSCKVIIIDKDNLVTKAVFIRGEKTISTQLQPVMLNKIGGWLKTLIKLLN